MEQAPEGRGHSRKPDTVQETFGQYCQAQGVILGASWGGPGVGLDDPGGCLPAQHVLWFYDHSKHIKDKR